MKQDSRRNMICAIVTVALFAVVGTAYASPRQPKSRVREKTTFQTAESWKPTTDVRADVVMVYGAGDGGEAFRQRVASWRDRGYTAHYMTGIAWGQYSDYFTGAWDGSEHLDEGQKNMRGDTVWHSPMVPYIVPTERYMQYFKERRIRPAIDAGIDAIFLEEPEFWARSGYSDAFKREWEAYYGFPWRAQHESAENTYLSNKLKYHLYYRALEDAFTYAKAYGREQGLDVRCYVPTHSLVNYCRWGIVSPEASLASMQCCDGYIAQVWTGTARSANYYDGVHRERVFETAYLEYGCMESMTRPTGRKMFFLTDPIEDQPRDWEDYRQNYQATYTAQLLWPQIADYEIMPWPDRIYEGWYQESAHSDKKIHIPPFYSTQMQVMVNALGTMPVSRQHLDGSRGLSVLMANSLMFQATAIEDYSDPDLSDFFGLALPLLKRGVPVSITHLENVGYADTWKGVKVLLMSYSNMKPMDASAHSHLAAWVHDGGTLVYSGRDDDVFQRVQEWWNTGGMTYAAPSCHLFEQMGLPQQPAEGMYRYGKGYVYVLRHDPKEYAMNKGGDGVLMATLEKAYGALEVKNHFTLRRGPYVLTAVMDESPAGYEPLLTEGTFVDLFDPELPVVKNKTTKPGCQSFLYDLGTLRGHRPQVLAAASRQYDEKVTRRGYSFVSKSPAGTKNVMCIALPRNARNPRCTVTDAQGQTLAGGCTTSVVRERIGGRTYNLLRLTFDNDPEGIKTEIEW